MSGKPEIRFAGFTDAWEQRSFDKLFDPIPNNTLSRAALNYETGKVKNIHYGDILIKYGAVTDCRIDEIPFITGGDVSDFKGQLLLDGDVLFADTAEDETVGKATEICGIGDDFVVSGLHTMAYRPKEKIAANYLGYYLNSTSYHHQLFSLMQGVKVLSISRRNLGKTLVSCPSSEQEQSEIGAAFVAIDRLISLHRREHDKTVNIKKAMLEKMFPKDGADKPEIRFAGFTDAWEKRKLGDVLKTYSFKTYLAEPKDGGKFPVIQQGDNPVVGFSDGNPFANYEDVVLFGDHTVSLYKPTKPFFVATDGLKIISGDGLDGTFLYSLFERYKPESEGYKRHFTILIDKAAWITNMDEQAKIGAYFSNLDNLISLHRRELEKLQNMKSALLEKMFV